MERNRARLLEKIRILLQQIDDVIAQDNACIDDRVKFTPSMLQYKGGIGHLQPIIPPGGMDIREKHRKTEIILYEMINQWLYNDKEDASF